MSQSNSETFSEPPYKVTKSGQTLPRKKALSAKPQTTKQRIKASFRVSAAPFKSSRPGSKFTRTKSTNANANSVCLEFAAEFDLGVGGNNPVIEVTDIKMAHMQKEMEKLVESMGLVSIEGSDDGSPLAQKPQKGLSLSELPSKTAPKTSVNATPPVAKPAGKATAKTTATRNREYLWRHCNGKGKSQVPRGLET